MSYDLSTGDDTRATESEIVPQRGIIRLFYDRTRGYRQELSADPLLVVRVADDEAVAEASIANGVVRDIRREPRPNPDSEMLLDFLLPVPTAIPFIVGGERTIGDRLCRSLLQGDRRFWISEESAVVCQVDTFGDATTVGQETTYGDYSELAEGVSFPRAIRSVQFGPERSVVEKRSYIVEKVGLDEDFDPNLLSIAAFLEQYPLDEAAR